MNKEKNQLKTAIVSTLLMTSKAINNSTIQQTNNASLVNLNQGTRANYTSPQQFSNLKKCLSSYNSHNYTGTAVNNSTSSHDRWLNHNFTGYYNPLNHSYEQNLQHAIQSKIINAVDKLKNVLNGSVDIYSGKDFGDATSINVKKINGKIPINVAAAIDTNGIKHAVCKYTVEPAIVAINIAGIKFT